MKKIKIIKSLDINKGKIVCNTMEEYEPVFLKQGDLDGACGPYCVMMALLTTGAVSMEKVNDLWNINKNSRLGKLVKAMHEHDTLFTQGTAIKELAALLDNSFGKILNTEIDERKGKSVLPFIISQLKDNNSVIVGIRNKEMAHWLLAVGYEYEDQVTKLFFLDPSGIDTSNYWNAAIDIYNTQAGRYPYAWIDHNEDSNEFVQLEEAIAIISKN